MRQEMFFEKFDQIADAPNAVPKMRELVLRKAVSGGLSGTQANQWKTAKVEHLTEIQNGFAFKSNYFNQVVHGMPLIRIRDLASESTEAFYSGEYRDEFVVKNGDFLIGMDGNFNIHRWNGPDALLNQRVCRLLNFTADIYPDFLFIAIQDHLDEIHRNTTFTTVKHISAKQIRDIAFPLPPLAEQKRIVAKVDELMALCDRLEVQQQERDTRHATLARASLARFAETPTPANLDFLFHKSYPITPADLRKFILTLAVQGTLVPQDPNDEPALALLDQIATQKAELSKEGKLRGSTSVAPMAPEERDFELPPTWAWVRFGEIMVNRDGERIPVSKEDRATKAKIYDYYGASGVIDKIDGYLFDKPLLLIGEDGANLINRSTPIAFMARGKYWVNNHAHVLDGISEDFLRYIELHINAINLEPYVTGSAQPKMNQAKMNSIPIALPPLAEQRRIVAKVDQLMALVDHLEIQLTASRVTAAKLMEAVVAELTTQDWTSKGSRLDIYQFPNGEGQTA